jgi:glycosyltransferase involved in cell wall biosynthesis
MVGRNRDSGAADAGVAGRPACYRNPGAPVHAGGAALPRRVDAVWSARAAAGRPRAIGPMPDVPSLTVVTPSFEQAAFLPRTLESVHGQGYPALEHIVLDGGSADGSAEIVEAWRPRLAYARSAPDDGQVAAINEGLRRATGDWVAWQNSDDVYMPGAFDAFADAVRRNPDAELVMGDLLLIDADDRPIREVRYVRPSVGALRAEGMLIANQAAFWRRSLHDRIGWLDARYRYSFDYDWFLRVVAAARAVHVPVVLGALRVHGEALSSRHAEAFGRENLAILGGRRPGPLVRGAYRLRRAALMAARGDVGYVLRGAVRRALPGARGA